MRKLTDYAASSAGQMMMLMLVFLVVMFIFADPNISAAIVVYAHILLYPIIGFGGQFPVLTLFCAGLLVTSLSSILTNFFSDWKKMAESQEVGKAFQKEIGEARKSGNTNKVQKLMKMQPEIMKKQTEAQSGMMKPMVFLMIFIFPIFIWLRTFLGGLPYFYFSVPWAEQVSLFSYPFIMQAWLLLYLVFSMVFGQLIRQGLKILSFSDWWKNIRSKIIPTLR